MCTAFGALAGSRRANAFRTARDQPGLPLEIVGAVFPENTSDMVANGTVAGCETDIELDDLGKRCLGHFFTTG
ncbi:hypothetical protein D3C78_1846340 [compost metagenome]